MTFITRNTNLHLCQILYVEQHDEFLVYINRFLNLQKGPSDVSMFDRKFTSVTPVDSPSEPVHGTESFRDIFMVSIQFLKNLEGLLLSTMI